MSRLYQDTFGIPNLVWFSGAIGGGFVLCALGIKSIFSSDVTLEVMDARLEITNTRLELAETATEIKNLTQSTFDATEQLQEANKSHTLLTEKLQSCRNELDKFLPSLAKFPRPELELIDPVPDQELQEVEQQLKQTQEKLEAEIDQIFQEEKP